MPEKKEIERTTFTLATAKFRDIVFGLDVEKKTGIHRQLYGFTARQNEKFIGGCVFDLFRGGEMVTCGGIFRARKDDELENYINKKLFRREIQLLQETYETIIKRIQVAIGHNVSVRELERVYGYDKFETLDENDILNDIKNGFLSVNTRETYYATTDTPKGTWCNTPYVLWYFDGNDESVIGIF